MNEKYLIFGQAYNSLEIGSTDATVDVTTDVVNPIASLNADSITNGILKVEIKDHADLVWGSAYDDSNHVVGEYIDISAGCTVAANGTVVTIKPHTGAGSDAVNGVTVSSTPGNNDVKLTILKHIDYVEEFCYPASGFLGAQIVNGTQTALFFSAATNDADADGTAGQPAAMNVDKITVTHDTGKFKELMENFNDAIAPDRNSSVIDFAHIGKGIFFNGNPAGINDIFPAIDT